MWSTCGSQGPQWKTDFVAIFWSLTFVECFLVHQPLYVSLYLATPLTVYTFLEDNINIRFHDQLLMQCLLGNKFDADFVAAAIVYKLAISICFRQNKNPTHSCPLLFHKRDWLVQTYSDGLKMNQMRDFQDGFPRFETWNLRNPDALVFYSKEVQRTKDGYSVLAGQLSQQQSPSSAHRKHHIDKI